jgi:quinoprotein glucose dehydrogenase
MDNTGAHYSPLSQLNVSNVSELKEAWTYKTNPGPEPPPVTKEQVAAGLAGYGVSSGFPPTEVTPLVVDGVLYSSTPYGHVVALDGATGREIWNYTLPSVVGRPQIRSFAYWPGDGTTPPAVYVSTMNRFIVALEAPTGKPAKNFGDSGLLDFGEATLNGKAKSRAALPSSPSFYKNILLTSGTGEPGAIRGWDARTGKRLWEWFAVPGPDDAAYPSWDKQAAATKTAYNWGFVSVDDANGTVFVPLTSVKYEYYGGDRPGDDLYGTSLVALDASTGRMKWYYQVTHHDLWDADLHHSPLLITVRKGIEIIPAVAVGTKRGYLFILDRNTGKPIWAVDERAVPTDGFVKGELPSKTQPFPAVTPPLARDHFGPDELNRITPEQASFCEGLLKNGRPDRPAGPNGLRTGGPYIPYDETGSILFPWTNGGVEWQGMSYDPKLGYIFATTNSLGEVFQAIPDSNPKRIRRYPFRNPATGWPCSNGPWGEMVAVDVNTGLLAWRRPLGEDPRLIAMGITDWGTQLQGAPISTAGGVSFVGATVDGKFRAIKSATGETLWEVSVGAASHNIPLTYMGRDGRQYVGALIAGGGFSGDVPIAPVIKMFALPKK